MSIADQFGKKRREPQVPPMPAASTLIPSTHDLHPAALEAVSSYSRALEEVDRLRAEISKLREESATEIRQLQSDLQVEKRVTTKLEEILAGERRQLEDFRRYAVAIRTHLEHLAHAAVQANDTAMKVDPNPLPPMSDARSEASREVAEALGPVAVGKVLDSSSDI